MGQPTDYYIEKSIIGTKYQKFICKLLSERYKIFLGNFTSPEDQYNIGENHQGFEIKNDSKLSIRGNLWIEVAEKSNPENANFVLSGIYRNDNSWLLVIGDYETIYIFSVKQLRWLDENGNFERVETPTSKAFLIPLEDADFYCVHKILFTGSI